MREAACCSSSGDGCRIDAEMPGQAREPRALAIADLFVGADDRIRERVEILPHPLVLDLADDLADGPSARSTSAAMNGSAPTSFARARIASRSRGSSVPSARAAAKRQPQHAQHVRLHRGRRAGCRARPADAAAAAESRRDRRHVWRHRRRHHQAALRQRRRGPAGRTSPGCETFRPTTCRPPTAAARFPRGPTPRRRPRAACSRSETTTARRPSGIGACRGLRLPRPPSTPRSTPPTSPSMSEIVHKCLNA